MIDKAASVCVVIVSALRLAAVACGTNQRGAGRAAAVVYPGPRDPSYLKPPGSIDDVPPWWVETNFHNPAGVTNVKGVIDRVLAGNDDHFYPPLSGPGSGRKATEH